MLLEQCLYTIPPTSVEAERAFSAAGLFNTKLTSSFNKLQNYRSLLHQTG